MTEKTHAHKRSEKPPYINLRGDYIVENNDDELLPSLGVPGKILYTPVIPLILFPCLLMTVLAFVVMLRLTLCPGWVPDIVCL